MGSVGFQVEPKVRYLAIFCEPLYLKIKIKFTCNSVVLCRIISPGGSWSAIALATARATVVGPDLCWFLSNLWREISVSAICFLSIPVSAISIIGFSLHIAVTSLLELNLERASVFLAVHFDLFAKLLLTVVVPAGILSLCMSSPLGSGPAEGVARLGRTSLKAALIRFCSHQSLLFPNARVQYGPSSASLKKGSIKVRKKRIGMIMKTFCIEIRAKPWCDSGFVGDLVDLAEVRFAVASFIQQYLSLPLPETQWFVPGGH